VSSTGWRVTLALLCAAGLGARAAAAVALEPAVALQPAVPRSALLVFAPADEHELAAMPGLSVGMMSASQGRYSPAQLLLDISQGARIASSGYPHAEPSPLRLRPLGRGAVIEGWQAARRRARAAPQLLTPGLLAGSVTGGAGYVGATGAGGLDAAAAAAPDGRIAETSLADAASLPARVAAMLTRRRLVVADVAEGAAGLAQLAALARGRRAEELLIVIQRSADRAHGALLWSAAAGLSGGGGRELTSPSTNERGLIASADVTATILRHLGSRALPEAIRGTPIETDGRLESAALRSLMGRLRVVGERRLPALGILLCAWTLALLLCAPWPAARARAMRLGGVGVLWAPVAVLVPAGFAPSAAVEYLTVALCCLALGALSDLLLPWPRAMLAPAVASIVALSADALAHTQLLVRSLMGPNPILGARFYGIGNEVKSGLAVLVLAAVAGLLYPAIRGSRAAAAMIAAGVLLAAVEGSARVGAGVGGVILVSAGFAVGAVLLAPGAVTRRRALIVLASPLVALVALAALDLLTAHGTGHYTGSILHARSTGELRDVIVRRYRAAWGELHNHAMPVATAIALACGVLGVRARSRLLAPVGEDPAWLAALAGGLAAGLVGALSEDSGPVLLVVAVFALGCVLSYLWGRPSFAHSSPAPRP
jgi:hypothetical protein